MNPVVIIGASTGGPTALSNILSHLPEDLPASVIVIQHILPDFTGSLAQRLEKKCPLPVKEGKHNELLYPGRVYIAPTNKHLTLKHGKISLDDRPPRNHVKPSVDYTMESAAKRYKKKVVGVLLTGAGSDGTDGLMAIKKAGGVTIAQDEQTCVVFGMPKNAILTGSVDYVLPLDQIARKIKKLVNADEHRP